MFIIITSTYICRIMSNLYLSKQEEVNGLYSLCGECYHNAT